LEAKQIELAVRAGDIYTGTVKKMKISKELGGDGFAAGVVDRIVSVPLRRNPERN
jgi:hypothetical protein